ncbi:MAG: hypothetical protein IJ723_00725 [Ruminococcus sp.]|nr:hypothetical protein [Ruminococcus sp.]
MTVRQLREAGLNEGAVIHAVITANNGYLNLKSWEYIKDLTDEMKERLTVRVCEDPEKLFDDIISEVMQSADPKHSTGIEEPTKKCLDGYKDMYMYSSGAVKHHHSGVGGLLYHSYRMVKSAAKISNIYPELDSELLVCAATLPQKLTGSQRKDDDKYVQQEY